MSQYLLSTYFVEGEVPGAPTTPEEMQLFMERVMALEAEMDADGTFVYGGALHGPEAASVVRPRAGDPLVTDGPFIESKEQIGGFYIIDADDHDRAPNGRARWLRPPIIRSRSVRSALPAA